MRDEYIFFSWIFVGGMVFALVILALMLLFQYRTYLMINDISEHLEDHLDEVS